MSCILDVNGSFVVIFDAFLFINHWLSSDFIHDFIKIMRVTFCFFRNPIEIQLTFAICMVNFILNIIDSHLDSIS